MGNEEKINSVQKIKPIILDLNNAKELKEIKRRFEATQKYLTKQINKAMFTRWERIKLFFMGVKI